MSPPLAGLPGHPPALWRKSVGLEPWSIEAMAPYALRWWDETTSLSSTEWASKITGQALTKNFSSTTVSSETQASKRVTRIRDTSSNGLYAGISPLLAEPFEVWQVAQIATMSGMWPLCTLGGSSWCAVNGGDSWGDPALMFQIVTQQTLYPGQQISGEWVLVRVVRDATGGALHLNGGAALGSEASALVSHSNLRVGNATNIDIRIAELVIVRRMPEHWAPDFANYLMGRWGLS